MAFFLCKKKGEHENMENQDTDESGSDVDEIIDILNHSHSIQITQDMDLKTD